MGNVCCGAGDGDLRRRRQLLKEGGEFKKKSAFLGVLSRSERVHLQLNDAGTRLLWRPLPGPGKTEELPLYRVARVCPGGALELVLLSPSGQKLLELTAESSAIRELWLQTLEELCACGKSGPSSSTSKTDASELDELARQEEKQKERYWKDRAGEVEQRRQDAEGRKKKLGLVGMKYTAQAMARR